MRTLTLLMLLIFCVSFNCYAETAQTNLMHVSAHLGGAYVITDVTELTCERIGDSSNRTLCTVIGVSLSTAANVAYKASENFPKDTKRSLISGGIGSLLSATVITLRW